MLWEVEIQPRDGEVDREAARVLAASRALKCNSVQQLSTSRVFLIEGDIDESRAHGAAEDVLVDGVTEKHKLQQLPEPTGGIHNDHTINVLYKPGMTDNTALSTIRELESRGLDIEAVATCRRYVFNKEVSESDIALLIRKCLANDNIETVARGPLQMESVALGKDYKFALKTIPISGLSDDELMQLSQDCMLSLSLEEMHTIQQYFEKLDREPTDAELESIAQTWSEHCSHKTLAGRIRYSDGETEHQYENMLKETIFASTVAIREQLGSDDWCVSVFKDNAGIVTFNDDFDICFKVETHNRPSALEPYGGANTGLGGVIRDCLGTGLGGKPVCSTDVFCFAPLDTPHESLPKGVLHPKSVMHGVVAGVRDYGNRMGIPTVNGSVFFDERYLGNPLVYCGNVAIIPCDKTDKKVRPNDMIVTVGGRTGLDGIHGATFSSAILTEDSEETSGGAVQIGNAITEKMVMDVILAARDRNLYSAITDCGAGGFSSAVGEMGEETGAEVWLDRAPLKYSGLSYTEIWISESQERMVLSVPPDCWDEFQCICEGEGVEATIIGKFTNDQRLTLKYREHIVADLEMSMLHDGRPPVVREATFTPRPITPVDLASEAFTRTSYNDDLLELLGMPNICSKEWIIRQYDHEVLAGSVVKPLVGANSDGPSDAAVVQPDLNSKRGAVISNGMNPYYGDFDPYWMAANAIDEAVRNCVAVGADPKKIAVLDNFCWGSTHEADKLGALVRAAIGCQETAIAYGTPFISGKDSLHNEFSYEADGQKETVSIPHSLLISAIGQLPDVTTAVTMDLKTSGNQLFLIGETRNELAGSHFHLLRNDDTGELPKPDFEQAPRIFDAMHEAIRKGCVRSCHDLSEGGLAVAIAEMAFAGEMGCHLDLEKLSERTGIDNAAVLLFSESPTRFLVEVPSERVEDFAWCFSSLPCTAIGSVTDDNRVVIQTGAKAEGQSTVIDAGLNELKKAWQNGLDWD